MERGGSTFCGDERVEKVELLMRASPFDHVNVDIDGACGAISFVEPGKLWPGVDETAFIRRSVAVALG